MAKYRLASSHRPPARAAAMFLSVAAFVGPLASASHAEIYIPPKDPAVEQAEVEQIRAYVADRATRMSVEAAHVQADAAIAQTMIEGQNAVMAAQSAALPPLQALPALLNTAGTLGQAHAASLAELGSANSRADSQRYSATTDMVKSIFDAKVRHDLGMAQVAASAMTGVPVGGLGGGSGTQAQSTGGAGADSSAGGSNAAPEAPTVGDVPADMAGALARQTPQYRSREAAEVGTGGGGSFRGRGASGSWSDSSSARRLWDDLNAPDGLLTVGGKCFGDVALGVAKDLLKGKVPTPPNPLKVAWCALTTHWDVGDDTLPPEVVSEMELRSTEQQLRHGPPTVRNAELLKALERLKDERVAAEADGVPPIDPNAGRPSIGPANTKSN